MSTTSVLQRARESGKCPPSLLSEERVNNEDGFDEAVLAALGATDFTLSSDPQIADKLQTVLQKAESIAKTPGASDEIKKAVLEQRRCIILAFVGATPSTSPSLERVLSYGYLSSVKLWLDQVLDGSVGGVDLLLHLLTSIIHLPVTKTIVKSSGMGKAIGGVEKHRMCVGTANETAIKERTKQIKDAWNESVKATKQKDAAAKASAGASPSPATKRPIEIQASPVSPKRVKTSDAKKSSSFSSLLQKVSSSTKGPGLASKGGSDQASNDAASSVTSTAQSSTDEKNGASKTSPKKTSKRVKWVDHFGGDLSVSQVVENGDLAEGGHEAMDKSVSWTERKKRDRMREKELLAKVKKAKLIDDDEDDLLDMRPVMQSTREWQVPSPLPARTDVNPAQVVSNEVTVQEERMKTVTAARYFSDFDVPSSPAPLSDVEQALDMTSQSSTVMATIPFFAPQQEEAPAPSEPVAAAGSAYPSLGQQPTNGHAAGISDPSVATPEFVQSLGLPMFLVGQNVQALQTLASSPGLLNTLVDANGMYDEARLLSLVQTLSGSQPGQSSAPSTYAPAPSPYPNVSAGSYGSFGSSQYQQPSSFSSRASFRGGSSEGNLHVSGYGPGTTEADIIALFSPYVIVDEVVMKSNFSFVNTSDPANAQKARETLNGSLLGGLPVRINPATRKSRDQSSSSAYGPAGGAGSSSRGSTYGASYGGASAVGQAAAPGANVPPAQAATGQVDIESVRDDRGNAATKNLFVAGYGHGTTEEQLRELFSQYATVIGVVNKGTFSFVNTTDRAQAVTVREQLGGTMLNGGVLRINFAKETGRLGTSFDLTYGVNTGPHARRGGGPGRPGGPGGPPGGPGGPGGPDGYYGPGRGY